MARRVCFATCRAVSQAASFQAETIACFHSVLHKLSIILRCTLAFLVFLVSSAAQKLLSIPFLITNITFRLADTKPATSRESQLAATIKTLEKSLARARADARTSVPCTKYTALLDKKKELASRCAQLSSQVAALQKVKGEKDKLESKCGELTVLNQVLRK